MHNIDYIMDMLDCENSLDIQAQGLELARGIRCINVFLRPHHPKHGKNVWENCAKILSDKSDDELKYYICELFIWLQDMNWPGANIIYNRLKTIPISEIRSEYEYSLFLAEMVKDTAWQQSLNAFLKDWENTGDGSAC